MLRTPAETFAAKARAKHGARFDYESTKYQGFKKPITVICLCHGEVHTTPKVHLSSRYGGCAVCRKTALTNTIRHTTDEFIRAARQVHGDRYDYHAVNYRGCLIKVTIVCPLHGPFQMRPSRHLEGRACRQCAFRRIGTERRLRFWDFVERVAKVHGARRYEYELADFVNMHSAISISCPHHGMFRQSVASHLNGTGCPRCIQSVGEQKVRAVLLEWNVDFEEQFKFTKCRDKRSLPFDFYVPNHRLLIEYDGRQHVENSELWGGPKKLAETQLHDALKDKFAKDHGFHLLRIPHHRVDEVEEIVGEALLTTTP